MIKIVIKRLRKKIVIDIKMEILYLRQTRVSSTKDSSVNFEYKKVLKKLKKITKLKSIEDQKFLIVLPNTSEVIYS